MAKFFKSSRNEFFFLNLDFYFCGSVKSIIPYNRTTRQIDNNQLNLNEDLRADEDKCNYVQMKGAPIPGAECQEGGMACDKGMCFDFTPK